MELLEVTWEKLLQMKGPLESIFTQKVSTSLAFELLDFISEYQGELNKLEALRNKLHEQDPATADAEFLQFVSSNSTTLTKKISKEQLLNNNVAVSGAELWTLRDVLK